MVFGGILHGVEFCWNNSGWRLDSRGHFIKILAEAEKRTIQLVFGAILFSLMKAEANT